MSDSQKKWAIFLGIGLVAGWIAGLILGTDGILRYLVSGVLGSFIGGTLLSMMGVKFADSKALVAQIISATVGAIVVVMLAKLLA